MTERPVSLWLCPETIGREGRPDLDYTFSSFFFFQSFISLLLPVLLGSIIYLLWPWTFGNCQRYPSQPKPFFASLNPAHGLGKLDDFE